MGCVEWDRNKSVWALRILSEVLLCTGIVACVAAFTLEQGKPNIYFLVSGLVLFLFASIGLASSFCLNYDGKKKEKFPVYTVTLPSPTQSITDSNNTDSSTVRTVSSSSSSGGAVGSNSERILPFSYLSRRLNYTYLYLREKIEKK
jgi:nitrate/nitrite transporter NarK